ncbi:hypothetical protein QN344_05760, partial [Mucilaginibacter sp. 5B2]|nr:hypothetical protein [Mucilaginibacter sp. 5B2]
MIKNCKNSVKFYSTPENVTGMIAFYKEIQWRATKYNKADNMRRIFFENGYMRYITDWMPNFQELKNMADGFNVGFTNKYAEHDCWIYGAAKYESGIFSNVSLDGNDFKVMQFNKSIAMAMYELAIITNEPKVIFN